jgi:TorA maturation chaperone TorD
VKIEEKDSLRNTVFTVTPSSVSEDFSSLFSKIKKLKMQPFYSVYVIIPSDYYFNFQKQLQDAALKIEQIEIKYGIARMEVS